MDTLLTGSFQNALYGTNVKKTNTNSSRTGKVQIAESPGRQASTGLKVAVLRDYFRQLKDMYTVIRIK